MGILVCCKSLCASRLFDAVFTLRCNCIFRFGEWNVMRASICPSVLAPHWSKSSEKKLLSLHQVMAVVALIFRPSAKMRKDAHKSCSDQKSLDGASRGSGGLQCG